MSAIAIPEITSTKEESFLIDPKQEQLMLDQIGDYLFASKYARYLPDEKRRETWEEAVARVEQMHLDRYDHLSDDYKQKISEAFDYVRAKKILPSMRSMQFGGKAIFAHNARIFNCATRHVDSIRSFSEIFYLLLCGCGVGIGLGQKFLGRLPDLVDHADKTGIVVNYVVEDSIEGWSDSIEALLSSYFKGTAFSGRKMIFDYSRIRPAGATLKTGGGKAPGYSGLKNAHIKIKTLLDKIIEVEKSDRLRSIDAYDVLMHVADAVLSGGIRRSATSVIFDKDDELMINAKTGNWFEENPQRARSNNSALLLRSELTEEEFQNIFQRTKEWGEPGFVFADHPDMLFNPCFEISFMPITEDGVCGVQFCNLCSINGAKVESIDDFMEAARASAIIGTLQAGYTEFPYLSNAAQELTEEEALIGVSITAMLQNPDILLDKTAQREAARVVVDVNKEWANVIGINQAARTTEVKPEGTGSWVIGTPFPGIHPKHSDVHFRRTQANKMDPVYKFFKQFNPQMCEESVYSANSTDDVITWPISVKEGISKGDLSALDHLEIIKSTQSNWVIPGTTDANKKPVHNNVSCTVVVEPEEWESVADYLYEYRHHFSAVSLLPATGDKDFKQAPFESVTTEDDIEKFQFLVNNLVPVNYEYMVEQEDGTTHMSEASCVGGACLV